MTQRLMPEKIYLGQGGATTISLLMMQRDDYQAGEVVFRGNNRVVMGFQLPPWQRGLVWSVGQNIAFLESLWRGVPCGTWTFNRVNDRPDLDDLLIDGQQRLNAIELYLQDSFPVMGYFWSEVTRIDRRFFSLITFSSYATETDDEDYLREYYNLMNFGGTAHSDSERA